MQTRSLKAKKYKRADREQDYTEQLEKEVRELKAINRSLLKQLKKISKGINREEYENALEKTASVKKKETRESGPSCPNCEHRQLFETRIGNRLFRRCETCGWKSGLIK